MSTAITRDQFIRGFRAIEAHYAGRASIEKAMEAAGWEDCRFGYDPVVLELEHQLAERCGDDVKALGGSMISYALNERHECSDPASGLTLKVDSAEAVWTWWETTQTGPFARNGLGDLTRYEIEAFSGSEGFGVDATAHKHGDWLKFSDVETMLLPEACAS